jgi:hypothetical protein
LDGALYHVASRGNAREDIFDEGGDRKTAFEVLRKVVNRFSSLCHAYEAERRYRLSRPALRYGQPIGKQELLQETRPDRFLVC